MHIKNSFFSKSTFTLSADENLDLETEQLKGDLQTICENSFLEEIEESLRHVVEGNLIDTINLIGFQIDNSLSLLELKAFCNPSTVPFMTPLS